MKYLAPRLALVALLLVGALAAAPAVLAGQEPTETAEELSPLEEAMNGLKQGMRALRRGLGDQETATAGLEIVRRMQEHALSAMHHCPPPLTDVDADGAAKWDINFKRMQLMVCDTLLQLELAIVEGRLADAKALYGKLNDLKGKGHDTYDPE
jgi:hypothetical protein